MTATMPNGPTQTPEFRLVLEPASVLKVLVSVIAVLGLLHLVSMPVYVEGMKAADGVHVRIARFLMLQHERSVPTWFTIILISYNVALLALNAFAARQSGRGNVLHWLALLGTFTFLSMDEMLVLHERVGAAIGRAYKLDGALSFPWVIVGSIVTTIVGLSFIGFLYRLPRRTAGLFVLSGGLYVGAALGIEVIEAWTTHHIGFGAVYYLEVLVEETMEMFGQALFAYAMLDYLAQLRTCLVLRIGPSGAAAPAKTEATVVARN